MHDLECLRLSFRLLELHGTRGAQDRAAPLDDVMDIRILELFNASLDQSLVAMVNTHDAHTFIDPRLYHCTDGSVHAGSISATGQNSNSFHNDSFPYLVVSTWVFKAFCGIISRSTL